MKYVYLFFISILFLSSCSVQKHTKFTVDSIKIGTEKQHIIKTFGTPFKTEISEKGEITLETLYYKEAIDVSYYTYILTTIFTFENSILIKMEQTEEAPPGSSVIVKDKS